MRITSLLSLLNLLSVSFASQTSTHRCPKYGCPIQPLEVNEFVARDALDALRSESSSDSDREEALDMLISAGDDEKTTLTLKSYKGGNPDHQINQDSAIIFSPYTIKGSKKKAQLLGVFDGHGPRGEVSSKFAATRMPRLLSKKLAQIDLDDEEAVSKALEETFVEVDKKDATQGTAGCTATVILQIAEKIYVANAGDSMSFLSAFVNGKSYIIYESREDKPELPEEKKRIVEAGGYVNIPEDDSEDVPRAYSVGEDGRLGMGLAMSRGLGDWENQGVIAVPIVDVLNTSDIISDALKYQHETCLEEASENDCDALKKESTVQIMACSISDGVSDFFRPAQVAAILAPAFFSEDSQHPHLAAEKIIIFSGYAWDKEYDGEYRDDITVAAATVVVGEGSQDEASASTGEEL